MPDAKITYKKPETLKVLKSLAKYYDFNIEVEKGKEGVSPNDILIKEDNSFNMTVFNDVNIIAGDESIDLSGREELVSSKNLDAKELRQRAWQRTK
jgi:hypothetical protein